MFENVNHSYESDDVLGAGKKVSNISMLIHRRPRSALSDSSTSSRPLEYSRGHVLNRSLYTYTHTHVCIYTGESRRPLSLSLYRIEKITDTRTEIKLIFISAKSSKVGNFPSVTMRASHHFRNYVVKTAFARRKQKCIIYTLLIVRTSYGGAIVVARCDMALCAVFHDLYRRKVKERGFRVTADPSQKMKRKPPLFSLSLSLFGYL